MAICDRLERVVESRLYIALFFSAAVTHLTATFYYHRDVSPTVHRTVTLVAAVVIVANTTLIGALIGCRNR